MSPSRITAIFLALVLVPSPGLGANADTAPPPASDYRLDDIQDAGTREAIEGFEALRAEGGMDPCMLNVEQGRMYCTYYCVVPLDRFTTDNVDALNEGDPDAISRYESLIASSEACNAVCTTRHSVEVCLD
jgi:hypothetical protein